ncbi:MAG: GntR family transcriptional regulator, partial [Kiritimatiellaeota bacterium]|nr:GntR family transcriptional regulator [Kiritimatiellota bacterium]
MIKSLKYQQFSNFLLGEIQKGVFKVGAQLPAERKLSKRYNLSHMTVNKALSGLVTTGYLKRVQGHGTFVVKNYPDGRKTSNAVGMVMLSKGDVHSEISRNIAKGFTKHKLFPVLINSDVIFDDSSVITFLKTLNSEQTRPYGFIIEGSLEFP